MDGSELLSAPSARGGLSSRSLPRRKVMKHSNKLHRMPLVSFLLGLSLLAPSLAAAATTTLAPTTGINASNTTWGSDNGSSCAGAMWACVDDGTTFAANDGDHTYVYSQAPSGYHTTGFAAVAGTVNQVVVHAVAAAVSGASGNATVSLYAS